MNTPSACQQYSLYAMISLTAFITQMEEELLIKEFYKKVCAEDSIAFDIGANTGFHTRHLLDICNSGMVFAVEANPNHVISLSKLLLDSKNLTLVAKAVVPGFLASKKTITFKVSDQFHGRGGIPGLHIWEKIDPSIQFDEVTVECLPFDNLIALASIPPTFIKMDIEGPEYSLIYKSGYLANCRKSELPYISFENSVHGLDIAGISFDDFNSSLDNIGLVLLDRQGKIIESEDQRRSSGQTAFIVPVENLRQSAELLNNNYLKLFSPQSLT